VVQLVSFLLFLYIMNRIMFRPLRNVMGLREDHIRRIKADTIDASQSYDELTEQIQDQESSIRSAALKAQRELEDSGNQEAKKILSEVQQEILGLRKKAEAEVTRQVDGVKAHLAAEADSLAVAIMEKVLERRLQR
jgi:F-type H+-transporting ATPase subunit b